MVGTAVGSSLTPLGAKVGIVGCMVGLAVVGAAVGSSDGSSLTTLGEKVGIVG